MLRLPKVCYDGDAESSSGGSGIGGDLSTGGFKSAERDLGLSTVDDVYGGNFEGDTGASMAQVDVGALAGGAAGFLSGVPFGTKLGYELGKKLDWNYEYAYDPKAAEQLAQDTLSSYEGGDDDAFKQLQTDIRTAKETASKTPTEDTEMSEADIEEQKRLERSTRLSSGRGGLLYQGDESGVGLSTKLGGD